VVLLWLVAPALAHDYVLDAGPRSGSGSRPVFGVVAWADERDVRRERPPTLVRLHRAGSTEPLPEVEGAWAEIVTGERAVVVGYLNAGATVALPWEKFRSYVATEGDARKVGIVEELPHEEQREHYRRSIKLVVGCDREGWDAVVGLPLELVPLEQPGSTASPRVASV